MTQKPRVQILVVVANVLVRVPCEPEAPTRHTDAQPVMPIGLSQIGRAAVCRVLTVLTMGVKITPPDPPKCEARPHAADRCIQCPSTSLVSLMQGYH